MAAVLKLLAHTPAESMAWLTRREDLCRNIYRQEPIIGHGNFRTGGFAAYHPDFSEIPWPVMLLLGSFSKKHIWEAVHKIPLRLVGDALATWDCRLKWAFFRRHKAETDVELKPLVRFEIPPCKDVLDAIVPKFSSAFKDEVMRHIKKASLIWNYHLPGFIRYARRWLLQNEMAAQLSDQDGVFALITKEEFLMLRAQALVKPCYRAVGPATVDLHHQAATKACLKLSLRLKDLGFDRWSYEACRWHRLKSGSRSSFLCRWSCTIKTHKED